MIHNDIQNQLALLVKTSAPPLIEIAENPVEAPQWVPGQRLPAHVVASLPNGRFQVEVGNQMLDMNLPRNSEPGQTIELTFISGTPRLTFALTQDLAQALPSNSAVSLSEAAKFLGALMQRGSQPSAATAALLASAPILPGAPASMEDFAAALQAAISKSGLFYESHQAQWVTGERTLSSLLQEPQAQLPPLALQHGKSSVPAGDIESLPQQAAGRAEAPAASRPGSVPAITPQEWQASSRSLVATSDAPVSAAAIPVHPLAQSLVQRQLESLDNGQMMWQGQVWPGQEMRWEIGEEGSRQEQEDGTLPRWHTRLRLELPSLGGVTAQLMLMGGTVQVGFAAERDTTADLMRGALGSLAQSMEAAGLRVGGMAVREDGSR